MNKKSKLPDPLDKKEFLNYLINKEVKITSLGIEYLGVLKKLDMESAYLLPYISSNLVLNKEYGKNRYYLEYSQPLLIPKMNIQIFERIPDGYLKKSVELSNRYENKIERMSLDEKKIDEIYKQLKNMKADVRINLENGTERIGRIYEIDTYRIYLKPYLTFENFAEKEGFWKKDQLFQVIGLEKEISLPLLKKNILNPEKLPNGYIDYLINNFK